MMSYPWITAILGGTGLDPLDEDACLPAAPRFAGGIGRI